MTENTFILYITCYDINSNIFSSRSGVQDLSCVKVLFQGLRSKSTKYQVVCNVFGII